MKSFEEGIKTQIWLTRMGRDEDETFLLDVFDYLCQCNKLHSRWRTRDYR